MSKIKKLGVCFTLILLSLIIIAVPCYASEAEYGGGIVLDFYSSYFWDSKNGTTKADYGYYYDVGYEFVRFEAEEPFKYNHYQSHFYCFTKTVKKPSRYIELNIGCHLRSGGYNLHADSGIYTVAFDSKGNSTIGTKIGSFDKIDTVTGEPLLRYRGDLPENFVVFVNFEKVDPLEASVSLFDIWAEPIDSLQNPEYSPQDFGKVDDFTNAEDNALGGKSDEQIAEETKAATTFDWGSIDYTKSQRIQNFFDNLLNAFGTGYKSVMLLSLVLGFAAFLIGRRYG